MALVKGRSLEFSVASLLHLRRKLEEQGEGRTQSQHSCVHDDHPNQCTKCSTRHSREVWMLILINQPLELFDF